MSIDRPWARAGLVVLLAWAGFVYAIYALGYLR
jgi:hypothetical protein